MKRIDWISLDGAARVAALERPRQRTDLALLVRVREIVDDVRARGWAALCDHARILDGDEPRLVAVAEAAAAARRDFESEQLAAIELACETITGFHQTSRPTDIEVETMPGVRVSKAWRPIDRVGLYVPGGRSPLFSTLLMLAIPARAAGVGALVVATPPRFDGGLDPAIALAADHCGIEAIWTMGGAQAIAALAFGAGAIAPVAKLCGPGNAWVAAAKAYAASLSGGPAIDMPAGPSELMVIADESADPRLVAADLLSQAEHDEAAQVILVTSDTRLSERVAEAVFAQLSSLPRAGTAQAAIGHARTIIVADLEQAIAVANAYAPEHLSLAVADPEAMVPRIRNAGAVFAGHAVAESFGDYLAGSSHVLPTDGAARAWSGISTQSFMKAMTVQRLSPHAVEALAGPAAALARLEGLEAHARAAESRREGVDA